MAFDLPAEIMGDGFELKINALEVGNPMRGIGDINGDGIGDYAIADPQYDAPNAGDQDNRGRVYVVFGQSRDMFLQYNLIDWINQGHGFIVTGAATDHLGTAIAGNCDVNGDGHSDLLISAPYSRVSANRPVARLNEADTQRAGKVYVINGHASGNIFAPSLTVADANADANYFNAVIFSEESDDYLGVSLSCGKDLNGDNIDDILIGSKISTAEKAQNFRRGRAYVVYGGNHFNTNVMPASGRLQLDLRAQTDTGMINAIDPTAQNPNQGIYIDASQFLQNGVIAPDSFSISVTHLGDVNGDTIGDFAIGAADASPASVTVSANDPSVIEGGYKSGQVYILFGGANLAPIKIDDVLNRRTSGVFITGQNSGHRLGLDVRWAGDINGDGVNDIVLGSPYVDTSETIDQGSAYVIFGRATLSGGIVLRDLDQPGPGGSAINGFVIDGVGGSSAYRVLGLGDVNGDGVDDMAVSAHTMAASNRGGGGGGAFVVYGRDHTVQVFPSRLSLTRLAEYFNGFGFVVYGDNPGEQAGEEMAALGDINADGIADFSLVSVMHFAKLNVVGRIFTIYGAANLETVEVREAHHEGAQVNRTPPPDNTLPQHTVGHAWGLFILLSICFIYRIINSRQYRRPPSGNFHF